MSHKISSKLYPGGLFNKYKRYRPRRYYYADGASGYMGVGATPREAVLDLRWQHRFYRREGLEE